MLNTGRISADDPDFADSEQDEKAILDLLESSDWGALADYCFPDKELPEINIQRRFAFRWVDSVRAWFARGDRG